MILLTEGHQCPPFLYGSRSPFLSHQLYTLEPVGLSFNTLGLPGPLMEAIRKVKDSRSFTSDSYVLNVLVEAKRQRFECWRRGAGFGNVQLSAYHHHRLDSQRSPTVGDLLRINDKIIKSSENSRHIWRG